MDSPAPLPSIPCGDNPGILRNVNGSLILAGILLGFDVVLCGCLFLTVPGCFFWIPIAMVRAAVWRGHWRLSAIRLLIPVMACGIAIGNSRLQSHIAHAHAEKIITACEQYRAKNGAYPKTLAELVPEYLPAVPILKYALYAGEFDYHEYKDGVHILHWTEIPPFGEEVYNFERKTWHFVD